MIVVLQYEKMFKEIRKDPESLKSRNAWVETNGPLPKWVKEYIEKKVSAASSGYIDYDKPIETKDDPDNLCVIVKFMVKPFKG